MDNLQQLITNASSQLGNLQSEDFQGGCTNCGYGSNKIVVNYSRCPYCYNDFTNHKESGTTNMAKQSVSPLIRQHPIIHSIVEGLHKNSKGMINHYLKHVVVHSSPRAMSEVIGDDHDPIHREAAYDRRSGTLHITKESSSSAIAHELGHVIDSPTENISNSPEFQRAYKKYGKHISAYGATMAPEGLAEMFRLRHEEGKEAIEQKHPQLVRAIRLYW